jgi:hypothetical protein
MTKEDAIALGWLDAHRFLRRYGVTARDDLHPEAWAHDLGVEIIEADLDGAAAQLIRLADVVQIVLPERIRDHCARRFAIAHELYHLWKRHPSLSATMMCTPKWLRGGQADQHEFEIGANAFAGAVLLPEFLLRRRCEVSPVSLEVPWKIAREYEVSILTSAIRFAELSSERCAAVFSKGGVVRWAARSRTFTRSIREGQRLHRDSIAWDYHASGVLDERDQTVPATAWLDTTSDVDIIEHSTCHPEYGTVLSMLWVPEAVGAQLGMP